MSVLPDELWHLILKLGTQTCRLDHRDLCNLAMANPRFNELSNEPSLWATLLSQDFSSSRYRHAEASKTLYRKKFREEQKAAEKAQRSAQQQNSRVDFDEFGMIFIYPFHTGGAEIQARRYNDGYDVYINHPSGIRQYYNYSAVNTKQESSITERCALYLEQKFRRNCNIGPKPKSVPNSRHYQPLRKPPRQAMPRKI